MNIKIAKNNSSYSTDIYEAEHINRSDNNIHKYFSVEYDDDGYSSNISPLNSLTKQIQFYQKDAMFVVQDLPDGNQVVLLRKLFTIFIKRKTRKYSCKNKYTIVFKLLPARVELATDTV